MNRFPVKALIVVAGVLFVVAVALPPALAQMTKDAEGKDQVKAQKKRCQLCEATKKQKMMLAEAAEALTVAKAAADSGDAAAASEQIVKAQELLDKVKSGFGICPKCHPGMARAAEPCTVMNKRCPIRGTKLDQYNVPEKLTRTFKDQKVGFCCAGCPAQWDKLSEQDKQAKLNAAK